MLKQEDNELITRVGPGTPMGNLMREYWVPALLSSELPAPDSDPVRVLLLGEQLIAFRDSTGKVGLLANNCPHRGASLFFGRNEQAGLRCVYHGWKFDTAGNCIDMPNLRSAALHEPGKVKAIAYPTQERGGIVWTYMGPRQQPPPLPDLEANMADGATATAFQLEGNWLQILEGDIDTTHVGFLHYGGLSPDDQPKGSFSEYQLRQKPAHFEVIETPGGVAYGARRPGPPGEYYWRIAQFCLPFFTFTPPGVLGVKKNNGARVPMDDYHTMSFFMNVGGRRPGSGPLGAVFPDRRPDSTDWYGRNRFVTDSGNDFLIDRELQRTGKGSGGFTGIASILMQDAAMTTSMGPIFDRSTEHLGSTDAMVIQVRRRLLNAVKAYAERGVTPSGVDNPDVYQVRSGGVYLPVEADWVEATRELRKAFVEHPELDPLLNGPL
jgi:phenylpropionate dioxygenase-like ring-hydroxylating dioxygenase large terminal subunit